MNKQIIEFFADRKAAWIKAKAKASEDVVEQNRLNQEAEERFAPANWFPDAARRAPQLSMVSHPGKFSHPSAKTSSIIAHCEHADDGYLRTGNVSYHLDVFGNAAAMDVYKFLCLQMDDGRTVLAHLETDSEAIKSVLTIPTASYDDLKQGLLSIKQADNSIKTDRLVKQVYFPVDDAYHLLSILTPSGLLSTLKKRVDAIRFSDATKEAKVARKNNELHATGYDDLFDLTVTAYGGTQPQNISVLNSQNAGRAYLLPSTPPGLLKRDIRLPTKDFFRNSLNPFQFKEHFISLHELMEYEVNNRAIRDQISTLITRIIDRVLEQVFATRLFGIGWSNADYYQPLPLSQRIWLDDFHLEKRESDTDWMEDIARNFARWILQTYEATLKDKHIMLSDNELTHIRKFVEDAIAKDKEFFQ
jgi:CRISPR-associated protein Csy1